MPRFTQEDLDEEILNSWDARVKSEQPEATPKKPVDILDLIYDID